MKKLKTIHPLLFAIAPVLFLYSHNVEELQLGVTFAPLLTTVLATLALWWAVWRLTKNPVKAALTVSLLLVWFFTYGHIYTAMSSTIAWTMGAPVRHRYLIPLWTALCVAVAYALWKTKRDLSGLSGALNVVAAVPVVTALAHITLYHFTGRAHLPTAMASPGPATSTSAAPPTSTQPDIYYIVLDAFANQSVLEQMFGYSDKEFLDGLRQRGFYVADRSRSNYAMTVMSMAATLNMDYLTSVGEKVGRQSRDLLPLKQIIRENQVARFLRGRGYTCLDLNPVAGFGYMAFQHALLRTTILCYREELQYFRDQTLDLLENLARLPGQDRSPLFVYAHIICPHGPYVFGPNGERLQDPGSQLIAGNRPEEKRLYVNQLKYISKRALGVIDTILARSKRPPVIILQSDHGPAVLGDLMRPTEALYRERMPILNAYYLPGGNGGKPYANITPVNSFRVLLNRYFGTSLPLLPDRSYFSTYKNPYDFLDVTDKVRPSAL